MTPSREARLRPEYGPLYPYLMPGVWESAAVLTERVAAGILDRVTGQLVGGERLLNPMHFEFRGAEARVPNTKRRYDA